jgi:hypothetical protein
MAKHGKLKSGENKQKKRGRRVEEIRKATMKWMRSEQ